MGLLLLNWRRYFQHKHWFVAGVSGKMRLILFKTYVWLDWYQLATALSGFSRIHIGCLLYDRSLSELIIQKKSLPHLHNFSEAEWLLGQIYMKTILIEV